MGEIEHLSYQYQVLPSSLSVATLWSNIKFVRCLPTLTIKTCPNNMLRLLKFPRVFSFSIFLGIEMSRIQQNLHYLEILIGATVSSVSTADGIKSKLIWLQNLNLRVKKIVKKVRILNDLNCKVCPQSVVLDTSRRSRPGLWLCTDM